MRSPNARRARFARSVALTLAVALLTSVVAGALAGGAGATATFDVALRGTTGQVRLPRPTATEPCDPAAARRFSGETELPAAALERAAGEVALSLAVVPAEGDGAYLAPAAAVTLSTNRGAVRLRLAAGDCARPGLTATPTTVAGSGTWTVEPLGEGGGAAAYRDATGSGTFELTAGLRSGAANAWTLRLSGDLIVPRPRIEAKVVRSYWSHAGVDYAGRLATVVYELTNTGAGEAYGGVVGTATGPAGVTALDWAPQSLGTLSPGESVLLPVRWRVKGLPGQGPVLTGRQFVADLAVTVSDVRDAATTTHLSVATVTPAFPPAL